MILILSQMTTFTLVWQCLIKLKGKGGSMKKTKFILIMVFILLTGLITGTIITYFLTKPNPEKFNFQKYHAMIIEGMINKLDLNEQQKQDFYKIHIKNLSSVCSILQKIKPDIIQLIEAETKEMYSILTPAQQKKLKEIRIMQLGRFKARFANTKLLIEQFPQDEK